MVLDDLYTYLQGAGVGLPMQKGTIAGEPDDVLAFRETGGFPPQHVLAVGPGNAVIEEPTIQVLARSMAYDTAEQAIRLVYRLLDGLRNQSINGVDYHFISALQPPFLLERDENDRFVLAFNVHIRRQTVP